MLLQDTKVSTTLFLAASIFCSKGSALSDYGAQKNLHAVNLFYLYNRTKVPPAWGVYEAAFFKAQRWTLSGTSLVVKEE